MKPEPASAPPVAVLAGGLGTRLAAAVPGRPKILAPVRGRPLLDWLLSDLAAAGFRRVLLSLGHRADEVIEAAGDGSYWGLAVTCLVEPAPRGTGGALKLAAEQLREPFVAMNGDGLLQAPWAELMAQTDTPVTILGAQVADTSDYGALEVAGPLGRVALRGFVEKGRPGAGWVNAGVYRLRPEVFAEVPAGRAVSLETEVLPTLLAGGWPIEVLCVPTTRFLDIGTPDRYAAAEGWSPSREQP